MGLKDQQRALAKLFTLSSARSDSLSDNEVLKENGLFIKDLGFIKDQLSIQISEFADSLIKKRLGQVKQHIPATCYIIKARLAEVFQDYAKNEPISGVKKHLNDSLMFMEYIGVNHSNFLKKDVYKSLYLFEKTWLKSMLANRFICIKFYSFDVNSTLKKFKLYDNSSVVSLGSPRICFWFKSSPNKHVLYREFYPRFWPVSFTKRLQVEN